MLVFILRYSGPVGNLLVMGGFQSLLKPSQCVVLFINISSVGIIITSSVMHDLFPQRMLWEETGVDPDSAGVQGEERVTL